MSQSFGTDVIVVGAGPVGLSAAMLLDSYGVQVTIIERRPFLEPPSVKSNHVSARTMERFRALGVGSLVRNAGLPADYPHDISFRISLTGTELGRVRIPSRSRRYTTTDGIDSSWETPEPPHRINQTYLEPILLQFAAGLPNVRIISSSEFLSFEQDADGVSVAYRDSEKIEQIISAQYLIGADGGSSAIRKQIGAKLTGDPVLQHVMSTCIRAQGLYETMPGEPAWAYYCYHPLRNGHVYSIDGEGKFLIHNHLTQEEFDNASVDRDSSIRHILGVDEAFPYEVVSEEDWVARRLVADKFRDGRAFIAGDAAHLWVPYAGYGMNAGIADALNLAWLLAAQVQGWAGPAMLNAYEAERQPITEQVSRFVMQHASDVVKSRAATPSELLEAGPEGEAARKRFGNEVVALNSNQFAAEGLNFGYMYDASPVIQYDGENAPSYSMSNYTPSTVPGCRLPHFWLREGVSIYDELGPGYTLLKLAEAPSTESIEAAAVSLGVPLKVVDLAKSTVHPAIGHALILTRPDQHIVWRGDELPDSPMNLMHLLTGRTPQESN